MAQYIVISYNAKKDVLDYIDHWAAKNGLPEAESVKIHWPFLHLSAEQKSRYSLIGHAAAYILPEGFPSEWEDVRVTEYREGHL